MEEKKNSVRRMDINLIRQFPERPGEWAGNRLVIVVCAGNNKIPSASVRPVNA